MKTTDNVAVQQIDKVSFQLDSVTHQPNELAFQLTKGNRLHIGQFDLPASDPRKPALLSLKIEGSALQVSLETQ